MVGQIWQWFRGLFQGLSDNKEIKTVSVRSSSLHQQTREDKQKSSPQLTDTDYEFLFTQLLEGVSHGWHEEKILKFFKQLGTRGDQEKWVIWLGRFGQKLLASPRVNHQLAAQMLQLGEITQSLPSIEKIGNASYEIGQQLLTVDANNIIWKDDSSDIAHDLDQEILADDTGNIIWEYDGADVEDASTSAPSEQESEIPSNIIWEYDEPDAEDASTSAPSEQESETLPFYHSPQTDVAYYLGQEIFTGDTENIIWESDNSNSNLEVPPTPLPAEPGQAIFSESQNSQTNVTDHIDTHILTENTGDIIWEYDGSDVEISPVGLSSEQEQETILTNQARETEIGEDVQPHLEVTPVGFPSEQEQETILTNQTRETEIGEDVQPHLEVTPVGFPSEQEQETIPSNQARETEMGEDVQPHLEVTPVRLPSEQEQETIPSNQARETEMGEDVQPHLEVTPVRLPSEQEQETILTNQARENEMGEDVQPHLEVTPVGLPPEQEQETILTNQTSENDLEEDVWENLLTDDTQVIWESNEIDTEVLSTPAPPEQEKASVNENPAISKQEKKSEPLKIPLNKEKQTKPITLYQLLVTLEQNDNLLSQLAEKFGTETTELEERIQDIMNQLR